MTNLEKSIDTLFCENICNNIAVSVGIGEKTVVELYRSGEKRINELTKFDMASVTKVISTTMLALIALDQGKIKLYDSISNYIECPDVRKQITIKNLLTHTMGIGHKSLCDDAYTYSDISDLILSIPLDAEIGSEVLYSCPGYILLGKILERIYDKPLDILFKEYVADPIGMHHSSYRPLDGDFVNSSEGGNLIGTVNDYNCRFLGGVAGNAGVFSNISDMKKFVGMILNDGYPIISKEILESACKNYTDSMSESRGLGFLYVDDRYTQTGKLFKNGAVGHCGHTGQSFFVDRRSGLYVIILSDMTVSTVKKYGCEHYDEVIMAREKIHNAILADLTEQGVM